MIPCDQEDAAGWIRERPVREVTNREIKAARKRWLKTNRTDERDPVNWPYLVGLRSLFHAREANDPTKARDASKMITPHLPAHGVIDDRASEAFIATDALLENPFQLPYMVSGQLQGCTPALFVPGEVSTTKVIGPPVRVMFCPTFAAVVAFKLFFNGLGVCLQCGDLFTKRRPKQFCCSADHTAAYRLIRWRARKKLEAGRKKATKQTKKGGIV